MENLERKCKKPYSKPTVQSEKVDANAMGDCKPHIITMPTGPRIGCCEVDQMSDYRRRFYRNAQSNGDTSHPYEIPIDVKESDDPNYVPWDYDIQF